MLLRAQFIIERGVIIIEELRIAWLNISLSTSNPNDNLFFTYRREDLLWRLTPIKRLYC